MRRLAFALVLPVLLVAAGCAGNTDPATNITNVSAQLHAHGHTTGEPATWWWEYSQVKADLGTANDIETCGSSGAPGTHCGPAQADNNGNDIPLSVTVTGLTPSTTYYFRACGQDQSATQPTCGTTLSFKTLAGTSYAFDRKWGSFGSGNGQFGHPTGIVVDSAGNVYVADVDNDRIQKFSSTGGFITKWGTSGTGNGQFNGPYGVSVDLSDNVYVTDFDNHRVQKFNSAGGFLTKWGTYGIDNGQFSRPADVAVVREYSGLDLVTRVYVVDPDIGVQKFDPSGSFIAKWTGFGSGDGQFNNPYALGANLSSGTNIYVGDYLNNRVQYFSGSGGFLGKWGTSGSADGQFLGPLGVAVDSAGAVYVADQQNNRIQKFGAHGAFIAKFGSSGTGNGQFDYPARVAVDKYGNVYVADTLHDRIQKFKPTQ